jgi:hypothetical protein
MLFNIAVLKLLIVGPTSNDAFWSMIKFFSFSDEEQEMMDEGLGLLTILEEDGAEAIEFDDSAYLARDIEQVLSWAPNLATVCPMSWVSHDLQRMREMPDEILGNYVGNRIGLA